MSLICHEDYLDAATRTYSSQNSEFPASNLYDQSLRGRVWRSAGYFEVTSSNNGIVIQETNTVNLTATIAEDNYTSMSSFLAAVKDALDLAGGSTYTVTQDVDTKRITIVSNGLGGGGLFKLMWTNVASTAYDLLGFDNAADDTGALTYAADEIRNHTVEFLKWDLGATSNPDAFIAIGKKNQAIKISENATVTLQGNLTDTWTSPAYSQVITYNEISLIALKTEGEDGLHTDPLRYWRLLIVDRENANGYVELSNVYLGESYKPDQGDVQFPFRVRMTDFSSPQIFQSGAKTFARRNRSEAFAMDWLGLTTTEKEEFDNIALDVGTSKAFYIVFDPEMVFGSSVNYNVRYVTLAADIDLTLVRPNLWSSTWSLDEVL